MIPIKRSREHDKPYGIEDHLEPMLWRESAPAPATTAV